MEFSTLTGIIGVALGALVTYLIARRQYSGTVATTDADRLWTQNEKLIDAYQTDNGHLRERLQAQDARLQSQDEKIWELTQRERQCIEQNAELKRKMERLERMLKVDINASTEADFDGAGSG